MNTSSFISNSTRGASSTSASTSKSYNRGGHRDRGHGGGQGGGAGGGAGGGRDFSIHSYSQLISDKDRDTNLVLYFVIPIDKDEDTISAQMDAAMTICHQNCLVMETIKESSIINKSVVPLPRNAFIFEEFTGPGYDILYKQFLETNCSFMLMGPQCILYIFHSNDPNCKMRNNCSPVYSLALSNIYITLSGFKDQNEKNEVKQKIKMMNGVITNALTNLTSYVVSKNGITEKSTCARNSKTPIMQPDWVHHLFEESSKDLIDLKDINLIKKYECPLFYNANICVSQVSASAKKTLKNIIEKNGGLYKAELLRGKTDLLVVPSCTGEKYNFAVKWGINIVRPEWIEFCDDNRKIVSVQDFPPAPAPVQQQPSRKPIINSTQVNSDASVKFPGDTMCSMISRQGRNSNLNLSRNLRTEDYSLQAMDDDLEVIKQAVEHGAFLDGYKVYLTSCKTQKQEEIKKLLNISGAIRFDEICDQVTHIIVSGNNISKKEREKILALDSAPHIITFAWLMESAQHKEPLPEEFYEFKIREANNNLDTSELKINGKNKSIQNVKENEVLRNGNNLDFANDDNDNYDEQIDVDPSSLHSISQEHEHEEQSIAPHINVNASLNTTPKSPAITSRRTRSTTSSVRSKINHNHDESEKEIVEVEPAEEESISEVSKNESSIAMLNYAAGAQDSPDLPDLDKSTSDRMKRIFKYATETPPNMYKSKYAYKIPRRHSTPEHVVMNRFADAVLEYYEREDAENAAAADSKEAKNDEVEVVEEKDQSPLIPLEVQVGGNNSNSPPKIVNCNKSTDEDQEDLVEDTSKTKKKKRKKSNNSENENDDNDSPQLHMSRKRSDRRSSKDSSKSNKSKNKSNDDEDVGLSKSKSRELTPSPPVPYHKKPNSGKRRLTSAPSSRSGEVSKINNIVDIDIDIEIEHQNHQNPKVVLSPTNSKSKRRHTSPPPQNSPPKSKLTRNQSTIKTRTYSKASSTIIATSTSTSRSKTVPTPTNLGLEKAKSTTSSKEKSSRPAPLPLPPQNQKPKTTVEISKSTRSSKRRKEGDNVDDGALLPPEEPSRPNANNNGVFKKPQLPPTSPILAQQPIIAQGRNSSLATTTISNTTNDNTTRGSSRITSTSTISSSKSKTISRSVSSVSTSNDKTKISKEKSSTKVKPSMIVMMSGLFEDYDKPELMKMFEENLGGQVSNSTNYDKDADGIIASSLNRSEKILCCIASGKFILKPSYIVDSCNAKKLLKVEDYLWTEEDYKREPEKSLAKAAVSSYSKFKNNDNSITQPFSRMKIFLTDTSPGKIEAYTRLIEAGGGIVQKSLDDEGTTMILGSDKKKGEELVKKLGLATAGIIVKHSLFLNEIILTFAV